MANYNYALRLLNEFENQNGSSLRIQLLHRASVRMLQREKNYWKRFFVQFSGFLYRHKNYYDNYVANTFKVIKTFFNYLEKEKGLVIGNYHRSFRIPLQQSAPVVLTPEQLNFLITNREFETGLNPSLKRAKDIFVFGCTVALRYSDLMNLKKTNLSRSEEGGISLVLYTQKTGAAISIPLPGYALQIIHRYRRKAGKWLLPRLSSSNLNIRVKKLAEKAGWTGPLPKYRSFRGRMMELKNKTGQTWQFHQHITAHTMRRTAITTLLILGVPENIVRKVSGHAPGSKEFYKYVNIAQEYLSRELVEAYKKLAGTPPLSQEKTNPGIG